MASYELILCFGLLGSVVSAINYLAPIPTFCKIRRRKDVGNYQQYPYLIALASSLLWAYYGSISSAYNLLITINTFGCVMEIIYLTFFLIYSPKKQRVITFTIFVVVVVGFALLVSLTQAYTNVREKQKIVGYVSSIFSIGVSLAPLGIMSMVFRTHNVEYMPFLPALFQTVSAIVWLIFGLLKRNYFIVVPNIASVIIGVAQMTMYAIYINASKTNNLEQELVEKTQQENQPIELGAETSEVIETYEIAVTTEISEAKERIVKT